MKLDSRLALCAKMVKGSYVCDIGTDHGCLPAFLLSEGKCSRAVCSDINAMPLKSAEETLRREGVRHMAQTLLSNGFESLDLSGVTDIVIAGMGGETIAGILSDDKSECSANFILQPMSRAEFLRDFLAKKGFEVNEEEAALQSGFAYTVMRCKFTAKPYEISPKRRITGILSKDSPAAREYVLRQCERLKKAAAGLINSADENAKKQGGQNLLLAEEICAEWDLEKR